MHASTKEVRIVFDHVGIKVRDLQASAAFHAAA
jgi:hypothetical protein